MSKVEFIEPGLWTNLSQTVLLIVVVSETNSGDFYLRTDERGVASACWLSVRAMPAIVVPAGNLKVVLSQL